MRCEVCGQWNREGAGRCVFCGNDPSSGEDRTAHLEGARAAAPADPPVPAPGRRGRRHLPVWIRVALPAAVILAWSLLVRLCR